jgi:thermitase
MLTPLLSPATRALLVCLSVAVGIVFPQNGSPTGRLLVQKAARVNEQAARQLLEQRGAKSERHIEPLGIQVLTLPRQALPAVRQALERSGAFVFVEEDVPVQLAAMPNDPAAVSQWHLERLRLPEAWALTIGSSSQVVAFIDSGVDWNHSDLAARLRPGWNFLTRTSDTQDRLGHGTATAGAAAAATNNGEGIAGVTWTNPVMPLVVEDGSGKGTLSGVADAIVYAVRKGVRVINASVSMTSLGSSTLQRAIDYAWKNDCIVVAAAGNEADWRPVYQPAAANRVLAVSATTAGDTRASYSNYGDWIDLAAPGDGILTLARGGGLRTVSGTSIAAPVASGVAALVLAVNPRLTAPQLTSILTLTADDLGVPGFDPYFGWGRVNASRAVAAARASLSAAPPAISSVSPTAGALLSGEVALSVTASAAAGIAQVETYLDEHRIGVMTAAPYTMNWNSGAAANGSHALTFRVIDTLGAAVSTQVAVSIRNAEIKDNIAPLVTITSPGTNTTVSQKFTVSVQAQDNVVVSELTLYLDGVVIDSVAAASLSAEVNARKLTPGIHILTAKAWDAAGNGANATPVMIYR